ncbi:hypothetical protein HNQ80_000344 [Anaerosolibacter carboniphilus]|uniref:DUF4309 domain-containing protein n=1 Tax=Anaerosolibacter carboniphilus TaxID=1417629 RepID=A0A841KVR7_9FIRM|nr:hypothetical protein [Anaerosolibacter carboniphilus]MBB6214275.1 hypothetical protein [Anaerosolibacter carboniphilus]
MINKFEKKSRIAFIVATGLIITISMGGLTGCSSKEPMKEGEVNKEVTTPKEITGENNKPINESKSDTENGSLTEYLGLLGLSKEELINKLNEKPNSIGEGGLEFKEAGIRVWFDQESYTLVDQIFIMRKDIDLNGVKVGDKISRFKEVFGNPISDRNGDAHFKYKDIFLSVNYDTKTEEIYGLYILKNDF